MSHSLLSVPLNLGVLHPLDAVHAAEDAYRDNKAPLAAVEGFIRQILGWRDYMWHLYWHFGPDVRARTTSSRPHAPLPDWWKTLDADEVTAECLRQALAGVRDRGWTHHIQRLMVLGNHALQRGYSPEPVDRMVRDGLCRRLSLGDDDQRRSAWGCTPTAASSPPSRTPSGSALHQQDERLLRRLCLRPEAATRRRRVPIHRRLLEFRASSPRPTHAQHQNSSCRVPRWKGSRTSMLS